MAAEDSSPPQSFEFVTAKMAVEDLSHLHLTVEDSSSPQPFDEFIPFRKV